MNVHFNLSLRVSPYVYRCVRWKQFKVRRDWSAPGAKKRNACDLALEYFDFAYGPIFGRAWPSIRIGLLSDAKYCAVVNTLTPCSEAIEKLRVRGAVDMLEIVKRYHSEKEEKTVSTLRIGGGGETENEDRDSLPDFDAEQKQLTHVSTSPKALSRSALKMMRLKGNEDVDDDDDEEEDMRLTNKVHDVPIVNEPFEIDNRLCEGLKVMVYPRGDISTFPQSSVSKEGSICWYLMDAASVLPVLALNIRYGDSVLDMCAAPGGKSLVSFMTRRPGVLVCNDSKSDRLNRLRRMMLQYVPDDDNLRKRIIVKRKDAITEWDEFEAYDRVLVDAPCSSDRLSLMEEKGNVFGLSPEMTQERAQLPVKQTKILINGLKALRPGGTLVYSTCTLSPQQNEGVVKEAIATLKEKGMDIQICNLESLEKAFGRAGFFRFQKRAQPGSLVLPFLPANHGPMYFCKMQRLS